jgi:hypothetical protein
LDIFVSFALSFHDFGGCGMRTIPFAVPNEYNLSLCGWQQQARQKINIAAASSRQR